MGPVELPRGRNAGERCPECGRPPARRCRCLLYHCTCPAGHDWWHCFGCGRQVKGPADHATDVRAQLCPECKTEVCPLPMW